MTFVDTWDSGQPKANWDSGLQWDVNVGLPSGSVAPWLSLVTSEHASKPNFMATLAASMLLGVPFMIVALFVKGRTMVPAIGVAAFFLLLNTAPLWPNRANFHLNFLNMAKVSGIP